MITLTAECLCDSCGRVVASGEAMPGNQYRPPLAAIDNAVEKAKAHGAAVGISTVTCKECLEKSRSIDATIT